MIELSVPDLIAISIATGGAIWGLVRYILSHHIKDAEEHKIDYKLFKEKQEIENRKNEVFRHKYDDFDKAVGKMIDQTKDSLSERIDRSIGPLSKSIENMGNSINLILNHILKKNEK